MRTELPKSFLDRANQNISTKFKVVSSPITIEDDTCTINNLMPFQKKYGRKDIRETLTRYI